MTLRNGVILFTASWAGESSQSARQILETACPLHNVPFAEVEDNEENGGVFDGMGIEVVPCVVMVREGKEVGRVNGVDSKEILSLLKKYESLAVNIKDLTEDLTEDSTKYLTKDSTEDSTVTASSTAVTSDMLRGLVGRSKLMLFIKGTPSRPQCGFTTQLIRLLSENGLSPTSHYATFNILEDQRVRESLKIWAQWPTYPQVYWKGELIGGLDILKEMFATGQMDEIIQELKND